MVEQLLCETDRRGVTTLTLNRPKKHNALDGRLVVELADRLAELARDQAVRVVVVTGSGASFCSGADLSWVKQVIEQGGAANRCDAQELALLMKRLNEFPKPTIARVNGAAYGGGLGLIACCDIAIADERALFAFTEVRIGFVAAIIAPYIVAAIGSRHARRYLLSGEDFNVTEALAMSLVHQVAASDKLSQAVERHLCALLQGEPHAQSESKKLVQQFVEYDLKRLAATAELTARVRASAVGRKGIERFIHRRGRRVLDD